MKKNLLTLFLLSALAFTQAQAQNCDPWIVKAYQQLYSRTPTAEECNIKNYNNGSWNSYDELVGYILTYQNQNKEVKGFCEKQGYYGRCSIIEFTNDDFVTKKK